MAVIYDAVGLNASVDCADNSSHLKQNKSHGYRPVHLQELLK